uniref:Rho-GAP domain-containing protein n=1 Tax=Heterorhabditis bacteriophora TaxID=37862 RepID=A0A1I7XK08_HETBA
MLYLVFYVESRGLYVEGIYRVSGSHDHMERLKRQFDSQQIVDLNQVDDIHTVCGLLKLYLRLLPQQLVPFSVYKALLVAYCNARSTHERSRACRLVFELFTCSIRIFFSIF